MSYIQRSLGDGERIIAIARFHWWYSVGAWLALIAPLLLLAGIVLYADDTDREWLALAALVLFALGLIVFFRMMIRKWTTEIGITSHRFVKKTGLVSLRTDEIALPNIEGVKSRPGRLGPHLGLWALAHRGHRRGCRDATHDRRSRRLSPRHRNRQRDQVISLACAAE